MQLIYTYDLCFLALLGNHSICFLDDGIRSHFDTICRKISDSICSGHAVIYAVETNPTPLLRKMKQNRALQDIEDYVQNGTLNLVDIAALYSRFVSKSVGGNAGTTTITATQMLQKWKNEVYRIKQDTRRKGVLIISDGSRIFAKTKNFDKLLLFEKSICQNASQRRWLEIVCCYNKKTIDKMPASYLISIIKNHSHHLDNMEERVGARIDDNRILSAIEKGIDDILGSGSGNIFFRTLKLVYKLEEDAMIEQPVLLEEKLQRMFGESGNRILESIGKRLRSEIFSY